MLLLFFTFEVCVCQYIVVYNTQKDLRVATISKTKKPSWHTVAKDLQEVTSITYLHSASIVCWVDDVVPQIECASFNGTHTWNRTVYAKMVPAGDGIACDWLTKKLYWTDNVSKRIEVRVTWCRIGVKSVKGKVSISECLSKNLTSITYEQR